MKIKITDKVFFILALITSSIYIYTNSELNNSDKQLIYLLIVVAFIIGYGSYADRERPKEEDWQGWKHE